MSRGTVSQLFRSWAFRPRTSSPRSTSFPLDLMRVEERLAPAALPTPTLIRPNAQLASVAVPNQVPMANNGNVTIDFLNPQVVADPANPLRQVLVATQYFNDPANQPSRLTAVAQFSTDGGVTFNSIPLVSGPPPRDPLLAADAQPTNRYTDSSSPSVAFGRDGTIYFTYLVHNAAKTSGIVQFRKGAFGSAPGTPVNLTQWVGQDAALNPTVAVDNNTPTFTDPSGPTFTDPIVTANGRSRAVYVAWNRNSLSVARDISPDQNTANRAFNPNPIQAVVSGDDGATFTTPNPVNANGFFAGFDQRGAAPTIGFAPGTADAPGAVVFAWPRQAQTQPTVGGALPDRNFSSVITDVSRPDRGVAGGEVTRAYVVRADSPGRTTIEDSPEAVAPATFDPGKSTFIPFPVTPATFGTDTAFTLRDLGIDLTVVSPRREDLRVELVAPNGNSVTLVRNRVLGDGNTPALFNGQAFANGLEPGGEQGAAPSAAKFSGIGVANGVFGKAVFTDSAARRINEPTNNIPGSGGYIGTFRPDQGNYTGGQSNILGSLRLDANNDGVISIAELTGTWNIVITDVRGNRFGAGTFGPQFYTGAGLTFSSVPVGFGVDNTLTGAVAAPIGPDFNQNGVTNLPIGAGVGLPPAVTVTFDTSLGSFSPFAGSVYLAYTGVVGDPANPLGSGGPVTDTNIRIARGTLTAAGAAATTQFRTPVKANDDTAADNLTEGNRPQFTPAVTVDATTGTLVATWYDARLDANKTRAATFLATSIDGGATFSPQAFTLTGAVPFVNQPKNVIDVITGAVYTQQPVPTNVPRATQSNGFGLGIRQSVIASGGRIYAYFAGNLNAPGSGILSAAAVTAVGPRVIANDAGPVTQSAFASGFLTDGTGFFEEYNTAVAADGTQGIDGFVVTFDRPIDPTQFTGLTQDQLSDIFQVRYRGPFDPLSAPGTVVPVASATVFFPGTRFVPTGTTSVLVRFAAAQYGIGTYSYAVGPNVRDRIRTQPAGSPVRFGNLMDQNANATAGEANFDVFAAPTPVSGVPFQTAYVSGSRPLSIPGPHLIGVAVPNGGSATDPTLVLAGVATAVDLTFDRDLSMNAANGPLFGTANVVRLTGPTGVLYERGVTPAGQITVTRLSPRVYRIGFPAQILSGSYTVEVDPLFAGAVPVTTATGQTRAALVDTNQNAGLDVLLGTATPATGTPASSVFSAVFSGQASVIPAASGAVPGRANFPLVVTDEFVIALSAGRQVQLQLNVSSASPDNPNVRDLVGELEAPDKTVIRLFTNVDNPGRPPGTVWFSNTLLTDTANTPIQAGFPPFDQGPYTPQFPLSALNGKAAAGTYTLRISNAGPKTPNLTSFSLTLPRVAAGTGLGEAIADRFAASFRVFNQNPTDVLTQRVWTPVGPAPENGPNASSNTSRTNGLAVDPSDPSGNTVYLGAASGGLWKTNDFLTTSAAGPTWVPLIDNAPTFGLNMVSIAVFPRNNDPRQSIIFALTGEGDTGSPGVGVLRSMDGGKSWVVLDSTDNSDTPGFGGAVTPINSTTRDRAFFGHTAFKIIVDPAAATDADRNVVVYMASDSGVWRSVDTGRHWTLIRAGQATDIVLSAGSAGTTGNLQILYAAFRGEGVFLANPAFITTSMTPLNGFPGGNGSFIDSDSKSSARVPIGLPGNGGPSGFKGRIVLATPALTNDRVRDLNYQGWLYALVITPGPGDLDGLYLSKDFGQSFTKVSLAEYSPRFGFGFGTNDYTKRDHNPFGGDPVLPSQGNYDVAIAIDPQNPNVVYIGGTNDGSFGPGGSGTGGFIRVDTTGVADTQAVVAYDNSQIDGNAVQFTEDTGNAVTKPANTRSETTNVLLGPGQPYGVNNRVSINTGLLNVLRDPDNPLVADSAVLFTNVARLKNSGIGARYSAFFAEVETDVHRIITMVDPITGLTRLIVGDDQGVASVVDDGTGLIATQIGSGAQTRALPEKVRNGNLQTVQFYSATAQPSQLAADIAQAMFYGMAQDDGFPISNPDILQTGTGTSPQQLSWAGPAGDGSWVVTDPTGSGTHYQYKWPCCGGGGNNFFQVNEVGRTLFLVQPGDNPDQGIGNWPLLGGPRFAVNPIDPNGLAISSPVTGRLFRSTDQGRTWFVAAEPGLIGGVHASALAFGAPDPANPGQLNNFLYAGTVAGRVFITFNGVGPFTEVSAGLDGSPVTAIAPNPVRGSRDAYAVTTTGVFYLADAAAPNARWVNITANLFILSRNILGDPNSGSRTGETAAARTFGGAGATYLAGGGLLTITPDWRYAIPVNPNNPAAGSFPVLYAGGYGGVFRSLDQGATWTLYPTGTTVTEVDANGRPVSVAIPDGGLLPAVEVTQLTLSLGNIDPATGQPLQQTGGLNLLTAATYGRGAFVIRLEDFATNPNPAIANIANFQVVRQSGPRVVGVNVLSNPVPSMPAMPGSPAVPAVPGRLRVQFDSPVLADTFNLSDITIRDSAGNRLTIVSITPIVDRVGPTNRPTLPAPGNPTDFHDLFEVEFLPADPAASVPAGFAEVIIGPFIADFGGFGMNQNGNARNGETFPDPTNGGAPADAYRGFVTLPRDTATAATLFIDLPTVAIAGEPTQVIVSALDPATGQPLTTFAGTVHFTTSDPLLAAAGLPPDFTFTAADRGTRSFTIVFKTATQPPAQTRLSVTDTTGAAGPAQAFVSVRAGAPALFTLSDLPNPIIAGQPGSFKLVVTDAFGNATSNYTGTVTLTSTDPRATFTPVTYTFQAAENGVHTFTNGVTLRTAGTQTVTATDATTPSRVLRGSQTVSVAPAAASTFLVNGLPPSVTAGQAAGFTVTAFDPFGNVATGYLGTVTFSSLTDGRATFAPPTYTFTAGDAGRRQFTLPDGVTFRTAGAQTLTVSGDGGLSATSAAVEVTPAAASQVTVDVPPVATAGQPVSITVSAADPFGNPTPGFTGTVFLTGSDPRGSLPSSYTFRDSDRGTKQFPGGATFRTAGTQTVSVTGSGLAGSQDSTQVFAAAASALRLDGLPPSVVAGQAASFTVTALDAFGNLATGFNQTVTFSSKNDPQATFAPPAYTFTAADNGSHFFGNGVTLRTAGSRTITVTSGGLSTTQTVPVLAAATARITLQVPASPAQVGVAFPVRVAAVDEFNNPTPGYDGTVGFSSDDPQASLPPSFTFGPADRGVRDFTVVLRTPGPRALTAADNAGRSATQVVSVVAALVAPQTPARFVLSGFQPQAQAGTARTFTVVAVDAAGAVVTGFSGPVTFSSSDPAAALPPTSTLTNGVGTFTVILNTPGTQTVRVAAAANPAVAGTLTGDVTTGPVVPPPPVGTTPQNFAVGTDATGVSTVNLVNPTGQTVASVLPFGEGFTGGVRTASADFNGDGVLDAVVGTGPGTTALVRVLDGKTNAELFAIQPFESSFNAGVFVAVGDLTGDGVPELIITPDVAGGPRVRIFSGRDFAQVADFFGIDDPAFRGGARAAVGDINGDGRPDLVVAAGFGGGPRMAVYDGPALGSTGGPKLFADFFAFEPEVRNGVFVAAGDTNGDGFAELVVGGGPGGGPRVLVLDGRTLSGNQPGVAAGTKSAVADFFAGNSSDRGGIRVAVKDLDGDGRGDVLAGAGAGTGSKVRAYSGKTLTPAGTPPELLDFDAFPGYAGGVFVG